MRQRDHHRYTCGEPQHQAVWNPSRSQQTFSHCEECQGHHPKHPTMNSIKNSYTYAQAQAINTVMYTGHTQLNSELSNRKSYMLASTICKQIVTRTPSIRTITIQERGVIKHTTDTIKSTNYTT